jgi:hypothetical protein
MESGPLSRSLVMSKKTVAVIILQPMMTNLIILLPLRKSADRRRGRKIHPNNQVSAIE